MFLPTAPAPTALIAASATKASPPLSSKKKRRHASCSIVFISHGAALNSERSRTPLNPEATHRNIVWATKSFRGCYGPSNLTLALIVRLSSTSSRLASTTPAACASWNCFLLTYVPNVNTIPQTAASVFSPAFLNLPPTSIDLDQPLSPTRHRRGPANPSLSYRFLKPFHTYTLASMDSLNLPQIPQRLRCHCPSVVLAWEMLSYATRNHHQPDHQLLRRACFRLRL